MVDLAGVLHPRRTERAVDSCLGAGIVSLASLHATFLELAGRGRTGTAVMRAILDDRTEGYVAPESELEARFLDLVRAAGLPEPVRQLDAGSDDRWVGRVDFAYPPFKLLLELDGRVHHSAKLDQEADEARDSILRAAGWRILRVTWHDITVAATALIRRLRLALRELGSCSAA